MRTDAAIDEANVLRFAELIEQRLGLHFESSSLKELAVILSARVRALRCAGVDAYLGRFEVGGSVHAELRELATMLTIGESYFFRSPEQFTVFTEVALPRLTRTQPDRQIRILSAGCATGEEPYTLAITLRELGPSACLHSSILGIDINPDSIVKARRGRYSPWAMRATPPECLEKYFHREREQFVLDEGVREMVRFEERNLAVEDSSFWQPHSFDVVFCRNVTMYLSARALAALIARFTKVLAPDGFLFLSYAEPLRRISHAFHVEHAHGAFYYVPRNASAAPEFRPSPPHPGSPPRSAPAAATSTSSLRAPIAIREPTLQAPDSASPPEPKASLSMGAVLMSAERFDEALATLEALPPAHTCDPDVLMLAAMIQMERGQLEEAAQLCTALLALDDLNAAGHYLTALCHEHGGRRADAVASYRVGVYLDRAFAMPHLRLGLMFRRDGDLLSARRELQNASTLLAQEEAGRILLFGRGFSRGTLIELCASELRLCGESS
jgi:chemotaxis protein methyltransferase CheR